MKALAGGELATRERSGLPKRDGTPRVERLFRVRRLRAGLEEAMGKP